MSSTESSYLPSDIIYEIFSRVSYDTLGRCGVVSKQWNQVTYDAKLHSQMNNIVVGFLVLPLLVNKHDCSFTSISHETREISLDFVPGSYVSLEVVSANYEIILCKSDNPRQYLIPRFFVCKPRIKLFQQIPNPKTKLWTERVAIYVIRSKPFRYKILRISSSKENFVKNYRRFNCEVFDSETWTWKKPKDIMVLNHMMFMCLEPDAVTVGGAFHWLMYPNLVFSFDVEEEEWKIHELPAKEDEYDSIKLVEYEEKLALMCTDSEGYMHTWVMENYKNQVWKKKFAINMKDLDSDDCTYTPIAFYGSDIIVLRKCWSLSLMYFDFKNGKFLKEAKLKKYIFTNCFLRLLPFWWNSEPCCGSSEEEAQQIKKEGGC